MRIFRRCTICGKWVPFCRIHSRDILMLFIGFYAGAMGTVLLAYFWSLIL